MSALGAIWDRLEVPLAAPSSALWDAIGDDLEALLGLLVEADGKRIAESVPWIERAVIAATAAGVPASEAERAELRAKVQRVADLALKAESVARQGAGMLAEVLGRFQAAELPPGTLFQG